MEAKTLTQHGDQEVELHLNKCLPKADAAPHGECQEVERLAGEFAVVVEPAVRVESVGVRKISVAAMNGIDV